MPQMQKQKHCGHIYVYTYVYAHLFEYTPIHMQIICTVHINRRILLQQPPKEDVLVIPTYMYLYTDIYVCMYTQTFIKNA